jgi:MFS family permease
MPQPPKHRWFAVAVFFFFMLLHQADKLLIGPLTTPIMETFGINEAQMGYVFSGAILVGAIFYPLWGYLYDRYSRAKLLSLASLLWGASTWLSAIAPTFPIFIGTRASTGIDDSSYPGLFSLIADYFPPKTRGKIYGLLQLTQPVGYLLGMVLALVLGGIIGWRSVFYVTGSLGIVLAGFIFFGVKEAARGGSEPELADVDLHGRYRFDWKIARGLFRKRSLLLLFGQGFFGVFPWQVITFWFFRYLETERGYSSDEVLVTMVIAVLVLAAGYPIGGALGDFFFKRTPRGRLLVCAAGVIVGAVLMYAALNVPPENKTLFLVLLCLDAVFIPLSSSNIIASVYDITLPEVRSTAYSVQSFIEQIGSAVAPTLAGLIAVNSSLEDAILKICISTWIICFFFLAGAAYVVPGDIHTLRQQLKARAKEEQNVRDEFTPTYAEEVPFHPMI